MTLKSRLKRALRTLGVRKPLAQPSVERELADKARQDRNWSLAADHYAAHLKLAPRDAGIWVQRGHMLKEAGRIVEAEQAYRKALRLRSRDADTLLHLGHIRRIRGDAAGAAALYGRAADIEMVPGLAAEMGLPSIQKFLSDEHLVAVEAYTAKQIGDVSNNLAILETSGVRALGDGRFEFADNDPWIKLEVRGLPADQRLAEIEFVVRGDYDHRPPSGRLYLDFGDGLSNEYSLQLTPGLTPDGDLVSRARLVNVGQLEGLRWDPDDKTNFAAIKSVSLRAIPDIEATLAAVREAYPAEIDVEANLEESRRLLTLDRISIQDSMELMRFLASGTASREMDYDFWIKRWIEPSPHDYATIEAMTEAFAIKPKFSFVMPVYNTPAGLLVECIESMLGQTYANFEICIADDNSPDPNVRTILDRYAAADSRVKVIHRRYNGHISAASNTAMSLATGDFVVLMDHDDLIPDYCLFVVADYINRYPDAQILFSDEDKITIDGDRFAPYFKGAFDRFLLYGHNMVSHLGVYRRDLLEKIGGFRLRLEGSQDYDLLLRGLEEVGEKAIVHIPHVLYHWRAIPGSTAVSADQKSYAIVAAQSAINGHFERTGATLRSIDGFAPGCTGVDCTREYQARISIIIPTRDGLEDLQACIDSVLEFDHHNTEILIVDNGSEDPATLEYLAKLEAEGVARTIPHPHPFNFSELNNVAAAQATGDILCFLNNDTEVLAKDWLRRARALLVMPEVGIVGSRLLYPDGTLQHFGLVTGMGDHKVAGTPHGGQPGKDAGYIGKARLMQQFSAVTAACMFVRADVFAAVGGFDPELRVAYNDVDLCLRVRQAGYRIVGDPDILLTHKESKTRGSDKTGERARRLAMEMETIRSRWSEVLDNDPFYSPNHSLGRADFALANPPRVPMPWKQSSV